MMHNFVPVNALVYFHAKTVLSSVSNLQFGSSTFMPI